MLITNREEILTLKFSFCPLLLEGTKRQETSHNFNFFLHIHSHQITLILKYVSTYSLAGWLQPIFCFGPLLGGGGDISNTSGDGGGISTTSGEVSTVTSSSLQMQETIS